MFFLLTILIIAILLAGAMLFLKAREIKSAERGVILRAVAIRMDPIAGKLTRAGNFFSFEILGDIFRFIAAKVGMQTAKMLISLRNLSSKLAAHLYHTSRKAENGDPLSAHPSFFIKAILEFKEKMKEEKKKE